MAHGKRRFFTGYYRPRCAAADLSRRGASSLALIAPAFVVCLLMRLRASPGPVLA